MPPLDVNVFHIGWICALSKEMAAAMAMLDEEYDMVAQQDVQDDNCYVLGRIHQHNVVVACMPEGVDGLVPAANVAKDMARTFPALRIGLMVGTGGGIPNLSKGVDVRLGDIVVSKPVKSWGGVIQYDKRKALEGGKVELKGQLNQPPSVLLKTLTMLSARHAMRPSKVSAFMSDALERNPMMKESGFEMPADPDCFHCGVCGQDIESFDVECGKHHAKRKQRRSTTPAIHYGVIASGNQVVKAATLRDQLRDEFYALCVEMEAAGLMNEFPCLVIRGICNYADSHKNDTWHSYAALAAAAFAKELLFYVSPAEAGQEKVIHQVIGPLGAIGHNLKAQLDEARQQLHATRIQTHQTQIQYINE